PRGRRGAPARCGGAAGPAGGGGALRGGGPGSRFSTGPWSPADNPMGLANWLTTLRILLIPVFVTLLVYRHPVLALLVFCLASLTDLLDGYIARSRGNQTRLGAFLDPVADKLLLTSAFVTLTWIKVIPFWIAVVVVSRD